jgi:hypothetical protein
MMQPAAAALAPSETSRCTATPQPRETWERTDPDALAALGDRIAKLSAQLNADSYRLLALIAEFDRLEGWKREGFASCVSWLAYRTRLDKITAREKVRVARALTQLPKTSEAMGRGELSFSQVRAITRAADPDSEEELLEHARTMSAAQLEKLARSWKKLAREDEAALEARIHASRTLSIFPNEEGAYLIRGRLEPEVAVLLMRAIEAASDALYQGSVPDVTPEQRRADALALLVERALARGFDPSDAPEGASAEALPMSERYTVLVHVEADGGAHLEDGTRVSSETARRIACDASVVRVSRTNEIEGKRRSVPRRLARALQIRDRGCRFPGCGSRFVHAHHIQHWADGGPTRLSNLVSLCAQHHRLLHEGGFSVRMDANRAGRPIFSTTSGSDIPEVPPRMIIDGAQLGRARPGVPRWEEDVPLSFYLRALDALD